MERPSQGGSAQIRAIFDALAGRHRRRVLYYLREHDEVTRTELTDMLVGWEATAREDGAVGPETWDRLEIILVHATLPKLTEVELVSYDPDTHVVSLEELPDWVDQCLDATLEAERETDQTIETNTNAAGNDEY